VDIKAQIDSRSLSRFQMLLIAMIFMTIYADGLDIALIGFIAPQLKIEWEVSQQVLGLVISAALLAQVFAALISGPLADRFGRRTIVILSVFWFGLWTVAAAWSTDATMLMALRFVAGLGFGAALPNAITLVSEYMPRSRQSFLVNLTICGFTLGAASGGLITAAILPYGSWHWLLVVGGVLPILIGIALTIWLPESITFLLDRRNDQEGVRRLAEKLGIAAAPGTIFTTRPSDRSDAGPVSTLMLPRYRFGTLNLWLSYFLVQFAFYLLSGWLPTLVKEGGNFSVAQAALAASAFQFGGPVGVVAVGWLMDRMAKARALGLALFAGAVSLVVIMSLQSNIALVCAFTAFAGFFLGGSTVGMNALAAAFYPTSARATGVSWMTGFGRIGATLSVITGGVLLSSGWAASSVIGLLLIPLLACVAAMMAFDRNERQFGTARPNEIAYVRSLAK
jgi:MFS transporter, AAHS family, 4-hydroxybenzoate transporter